MSDIRRDENGAYTWVYELHLMRNPVVLLVLLKIFFWIIFSLWTLMTLASVLRGHLTWRALWTDARMMLLICAFMAALTLVGYTVYAAVMGWRYIVVFTMDDRGIEHRQLPQQFEKAEGLAAVSAALGARAGRLSAAGAGLNAMGHDRMFTEFCHVRRVKAVRGLHTIKLTEGLEHNQIYVPQEDFDFVLDYILARVPARAKRKV